MADSFKLYGVIDTTTGKLVSNLTNPRHKYWESRKRAEAALASYNPNYITNSYKIHNGIIENKENLKVVEILCTVVE